MRTTVLLLLPLACTESAPSSTATQASSTAAPAVAAQAIREAPLAVDLKKLLGEYKDNEVRADGQFKGKAIQTSGVVQDIKKDLTGEVYVTIGSGQDLEIPVVQCFVASNQISEASALSKGQRATVQGRVDGLLMNVLARECQINPVAQLCRRMLPAVGGRKCVTSDETGDAIGLVIGEGKDEVIAGLMCIAAREGKSAPDLYKVAVGALSTEGAVVVGSEHALCLSFVKKVAKNAGPPPDEVVAKVRAFVDAL